MPIKDKVPLELTDLELKFMSKINPKIKDVSSKGKEFYFLPLSKEAKHYKENECQKNVETAIRKNGGKPLMGWLIFKSQIFLEAYYHHVWITQKGEIKDITPRVDKEKLVLFVVDPSQIDDGLIRNNIREILLDIPLVHQLDEVLTKKIGIQRKSWVPFENGFGAPMTIHFEINKLEYQRIKLINDINNFLDSSSSNKS